MFVIGGIYTLKDFSKDDFDVIIQAGQSNSEGCGLGDAEAPFERSGRVWYLTGDFNEFVICAANEDRWGNDIVGNFSLSFAREYMNAGLLADGRKILIIRAAVGGTGFSDGRWGMKDDLFLRMTDMIRTALGLNPRNRATALLWHQGETDACNYLPGETYGQALTALVAAVRDACGDGDLPFVAGDFVQEWKAENAAICEPIIAASRRVCAGVGKAAFVETDGLKSNTQDTGKDCNIHFCREAQYVLGRRYFEAFAKI
ncbi:MAG: sialate O-acetylesterase [Defluviitaleaceae bacterium]|nr:sialate O-acetylesterase [Defluviitaleaceae bacterium]